MNRKKWYNSSPRGEGTAVGSFRFSQARSAKAVTGIHPRRRMFLPLLGGEGGVRASVPTHFFPFCAVAASGVPEPSAVRRVPP